MRSFVSIVQIRAADVEAGDVVNKRGPERTGWIEVETIEQLQSGEYVVHDEKQRDSFTAIGYDLIWLQVVSTLNANSHMPVDV